MIKSIHFKNYKSFKELNFEIKRYQGDGNICLIYGENGSGKSNLISALYFLNELTVSLNLLERLKEFIYEREFERDAVPDFIDKYFKEKEIENILKKTKRIGSKEEMLFEFTFLIKDKEFKYHLAFNDKRLVYEALFAPLAINQVKVFEIDYRKELEVYFNNNLFRNSYRSEIRESLKKYFGKHTLLAIIKSDLRKKNKEYLFNSIHKALFDFINYLSNVAILYKEDVDYGEKVISNHPKLLLNLESGTITKDEVVNLEKTEAALDFYYKSLFADVKKAFYKKTARENEIDYQLYLKKIIGGDLIEIPLFLESRGTKKLLELFPLFIKLLNGGVVVIDELEAGVHDILISLLIKRLEEIDLKGQLIATTHNTTLLDVINKNQIYLIDIDDLGNKDIYSLRSSGVTIQPNHSLYNNYKKGAFGGVPNPGYFDFNDLNCFLSEKTKKKEL